MTGVQKYNNHETVMLHSSFYTDEVTKFVTVPIYPSITTHAQLSARAKKTAGIMDEYIRFLIGIEHIDDTIVD